MYQSNHLQKGESNASVVQQAVNGCRVVGDTPVLWRCGLTQLQLPLASAKTATDRTAIETWIQPAPFTQTLASTSHLSWGVFCLHSKAIARTRANSNRTTPAHQQLLSGVQPTFAQASTAPPSTCPTALQRDHGRQSPQKLPAAGGVGKGREGSRCW